MKGAWVLVLLAGCGDDAPPFDELPLRDALRADPEVIAALSERARARLAARLEAARTTDVVAEMSDGGEGTPGALIARLDGARERGAREPLVVGSIAASVIRPLREPVASDGARLLPPLESATDAVITPLESRTLASQGGTLLRALLDVSGSHRLRRVVGWPAGAVAVADTVYVNAAWLAALAPGTDGGVDAEVFPSTVRTMATGSVAAPATATASAEAPSGQSPLPSTSPADEVLALTLDTAATPPATSPDAGMDPIPPYTVDTGDGCASFADACSSCADACDSSSAGGGDACSSTPDDGSGDACSSTPDDGSADACSSPPDDGSGSACSAPPDDGSGDACSGTPDDGSGTSCQVARGSRRGGRGTLAGLLAPLAFLLSRRRR